LVGDTSRRDFVAGVAAREPSEADEDVGGPRKGCQPLRGPVEVDENSRCSKWVAPLPAASSPRKSSPLRVATRPT